jgi:flagellar biosynthesis chaperone FliJ
MLLQEKYKKEVTGRRRRRRNQELDEFSEKRG